MSAPAAAKASREATLDEALEAILKRDRIVVVVGLALLTVVSWVYMVYLAWDMQQMDMEMAMPQMQAWTAWDLVLLFIMWAVMMVAMMVAMMVPSAAPMILLFATINRRRQARRQPFVPTAAFVGGYLLVWTAYSALATLAQWGLHSAALLSPMMVSTSPILGGVLLLAAGVFQWLPLKSTCLNHCRSPIGFITSQWREGPLGALIMGLRHGSYCTVCCWALMALLFVGGVMNLLWVAAIAAFVLIEKAAPAGIWVSRVAGVLLVAAGVWMAASTSA